MNDKRSLGDRLRDATWTPMSEKSRAAHMTAIETALDSDTQTVPARPVPRRRLAVAVVAAALFALPTGMAFAAEGSVPGDVLYPIKRVTETVRSWVDDDVVAQHRVDELVELLDRDAPRDDILTQLDRATVEVDQLANDHALQPVLVDLTAEVADRPTKDDDVVADDRDRPDVASTTTTVITDVTSTTDRPTDRTTTTTTPTTDTTMPPDIEGVRVVGVVTAGPTCPVQQFPPVPGCEDQAVPGAILVVEDAEGKEVQRLETDREGRFSTRLPTGNYVLRPLPVDGLLGTAPPQDFSVGDQPVELTIGYDTGIR